MADPVPAVAVVAAVQKAPDAISIGGYAMMGLGGLFLVFLIYVFWRAQRDKENRVDLTELLIDPATGRTSQSRFWSLIGGTVATWVFLFLPVSGHFDAAFAAAYLTLMFGIKVAGDITSKPVPGASSSTTTTTTTAQAAPVPVAALQPAAGVETLNPKIGPEDVGKSVALVRKPIKRKRKG